jgi:glucose/arabinose dehydrogenase
MRKWIIGFVFALALVAGIAYIFREDLIKFLMQPTDSSLKSENISQNNEIVAQNLETPWGIEFLPNGDMLVPERSGQLQRIGEDKAIIQIQGVRETSEGGLLGIALSPDFASNNHVFLYYTTGGSSELTNQVDRYTLRDNDLSERTDIITNIPAASNHNGGEIAFGPDGKLYVTTGDAQEERYPQDRNSLAGKILRINTDGTIPDDNPFGNAVWSYGHRNPQGIAWDDQGQLWSVEHGPSGSQTGNDELNKITRGANYGWPVIIGTQTQAGMQAPVVESGDNETWAPGGMTYLDGSLYFAGLRGQSLYKVDVSDPNKVSKASITRLFANEYGRLRAVTAHDGAIHISTSNRDGRGSPSDGDDKIIRFK